MDPKPESAVARILDISSPLSPNLAVWPGDVPFTREAGSRLSDGDPVDLSSMRTTLHIGTHADAPSHVMQGGPTIDELELSPFLGPCEVIEVNLPAGERILPSHLKARVQAPRVLFKTSSCPDPTRFNEAFNSLSPELIGCLAEQGCVLLGLDTPSVDPFDSVDLESHRALFERGIRSLEGLRLEDARPGLYTLIALPLRIEGGDASPVRAVLMEDAHR
jgi:arylformamidase